ncbi:MAG: DUF456 family protein [Bacteroidales bacterium]|nr:DUF456 family protein [Bacteroidales bacterium]MCF8388194.1 DUF456 family protein [Bacteroidales bacterium]MCF8399029.1 DUF456 family protein [Bacteroidales bacterium]
MDWLLITLGIIALLLGIIGAVLPVLPGPAISYAALILLQFTEEAPFSERFLVVMGLVMGAVTLLDYVVPIYGTKKFGGSKAGIRGSMIGLVIGIVILPLLGIVIGPFGILGIILGPFVGAYIAETSTGKDSDRALIAAFGSFVGFLTGTLMKLTYSVIVVFYFFKAAFFL